MKFFGKKYFIVKFDVVSVLKTVACKKEIEILDKMNALNREQENAKEEAAILENSIIDLKLQLRKAKVNSVSCGYQTNVNGFEATVEESLLTASSKIELELQKKREELRLKQDEIEKAKQFIGTFSSQVSPIIYY